MSTSRRANKRLAQQLHTAASQPTPLRDDLEVIVSNYRPNGCSDIEWETARSLFEHAMRRSNISGVASMKKHAPAVAQYCVYRTQNGLSLAVGEAFSAVQIDRYYLHGMTGKSDRTRNDYRSRILAVARNVSVGLGGPVVGPSLGHRPVRPGYTTVEEAQIRRVAMRQRSQLRRRQLCAIVALTMGAGLAPSDLRALRVRAVVDHGDDGIEVLLGDGDTQRSAWLRRNYENLMRIGIDGLSAHQLVIGEKVDRRNVTAGVIDRSEQLDGPELNASRMRSTWLTWALQQRIPLQLIMQTAGLKTARSLTQLIADLDNATDDGAGPLLRGDDQ